MVNMHVAKPSSKIRKFESQALWPDSHAEGIMHIYGLAEGPFTLEIWAKPKSVYCAAESAFT